jgi:hypothetical protein
MKDKLLIPHYTVLAMVGAFCAGVIIGAMFL